MNHQCHWTEVENIFMPREATIVRSKQATDTETHFTLKMNDGVAMEYEPGQIVELSLPGYGEIPIGFASSPTRKNTFDLVVRSVGRVSSAVNRLEKGQSLFVRGPLGHGFELDKFRGHDVLIVAGGIGLCPTRSFIQYILDRREEFKRFILFYGVRESSLQLFRGDLADWRDSNDVEFYETVDKSDPTWTGNVGVITTLFPKVEISPETRTVICGPPIFYRFVVAELDKLGVPRENIYVDMERRMKCGVGKCGHCQINDKYVCVDGPVFTFTDVQGLEEAF
jgi:sulfhydrogenase subunit gamma (sulfur reductase)